MRACSPAVWGLEFYQSLLGVCMHAKSLQSVCYSLQPQGLYLPGCQWDSPGKNTGVRCHFLLQRIFPAQGSNPHPLHWQAGSSATWEAPHWINLSDAPPGMETGLGKTGHQEMPSWDLVHTNSHRQLFLILLMEAGKAGCSHRAQHPVLSISERGGSGRPCRSAAK